MGIVDAAVERCAGRLTDSVDLLVFIDSNVVIIENALQESVRPSLALTRNSGVATTVKVGGSASLVTPPPLSLFLSLPIAAGYERLLLACERMLQKSNEHSLMLVAFNDSI